MAIEVVFVPCFVSTLSLHDQVSEGIVTVFAGPGPDDATAIENDGAPISLREKIVLAVVFVMLARSTVLEHVYDVLLTIVSKYDRSSMQILGRGQTTLAVVLKISPGHCGPIGLDDGPFDHAVETVVVEPLGKAVR